MKRKTYIKEILATTEKYELQLKMNKDATNVFIRNSSIFVRFEEPQPAKATMDILLEDVPVAYIIEYLWSHTNDEFFIELTTDDALALVVKNLSKIVTKDHSIVTVVVTPRRTHIK